MDDSERTESGNRVTPPQGRERLGLQIGELRAELGKREEELSGLRGQIEARIRELTRIKAEAARYSIEKRIVGPRFKAQMTPLSLRRRIRASLSRSGHCQLSRSC